MEELRPWTDRVANAIPPFTGSMTFVFLHVAIYGGWIVVNSGKVGLRPVGPFPFVMLAVVGPVEAMFLSTFIPIKAGRHGSPSAAPS